MDKFPESKSALVPPKAKPEAARQAEDVRARWEWTDRGIWTDHMLTALENGVKGGQWFSLKRWPIAFFDEQGLFNLTTALARKRQSSTR